MRHPPPSPISQQSSEVIGAQLIHESGLVFSCSSLTPLTPGTCFNVTGNTTANCERFSINLNAVQRGNGHRDIALHINPRLPQNYIVRNCLCNGTWGTEEVTSPLPFRLRRGHPFAVQVLCTETDYYIAVDGRHFAAFRHRLPYQKVSSLQVFGDVTHVQVDQLSIMQYPDSLCGNNGGNSIMAAADNEDPISDALWHKVDNVTASQLIVDRNRFMTMTKTENSLVSAVRHLYLLPTNSHKTNYIPKKNRRCLSTVSCNHRFASVNRCTFTAP